MFHSPAFKKHCCNFKRFLSFKILMRCSHLAKDATNQLLCSIWRIPVRIPKQSLTHPECHISHVCPMIMVIMRRNCELCADLVTFTLQLRKTPRKNSARRTFEGCAVRHRLKWGPLPPNDVGRIV